jgi:hypothetical protein
MNDQKRPYDTASPNADIARQVLLDWLRDNPTAKHMNYDGHAYLPYVDLVGRADFDALASQIMEAFWELVIQGIVVPGKGSQLSEICLPWFRLTPYGRRVLQTGVGHPYDPAGYLTRIRKQVTSPDDTVMAYLAEALDTFRKASHIASMVMLGIAAERVFLLLCDSLRAALANLSEEATLARLLDRFAIKPKLDWVHAKLQAVQASRQPGFPDNATLMVTAIYDILRSQRNDLGHPRDAPPGVDREEAFANLQIFPRFYETAEQLRTWLATHKV